jgi:hypothetical protein
MPVMLVRNTTPGPLVLVDERNGNREEFQWQPGGSPLDEDLLEVPETLASNVNFRRNVQKGNLRIEQTIQDDMALMGPNDQDWIAKQRQLGQGSVPTSVVGETRTADGIPVIMDKEAAAPISTMTLDADGNIVEVAAPPAQQQRGRASQAPVEPTAQQPEGVPEVAGGHLDPNSP